MATTITGPSGKKRRLENDESNHSISQTDNQQHFLPFHLEVLKSLYKEHDQGSKLGSDSSVDDPNIDWVSMEEFLRSRGALLTCKGNAVQCRAIHNEALKFIQSDNVITGDSFGQSVDRGVIDMTRPDISPPQLKPLLSSRPNAPKKRKHGGLAIVAKFLGHRADKAENALQGQVSKWRSMLDMARRHIAVLQKTKEAHQKVLLERQITISREVMSINVYASSSQRGETVTDRIQESRRQSVDEQSKLAATESKLQLWSMLEKELMQVVV